MALVPTTVGDGSLNGGDFRVGKSLQTDYGVVNTSPVFTPVRRTSGKTSKTVSYVQDETVRDDYQGLEQIQDSVDLGVNIESTFSKQSVGLLIESMFAAETIYTNTAITFAALVNGYTVPAATYAALSVGDGFWVSGFANSALNIFNIVTSKTGGTTIVTAIAPAALESAGASVTLKFNKYSNSLNSYYNTFQTRATDLSAAGDIDYHTVYDALINAFSMEIGETGIVTATAEYMAEREVAGTATIAGQSYVAAATDRAVSSVQDIKAFYVNDVPATCSVKSLSIEVATNLQADDAAGCTKRYSRGAFGVSGSCVVRAMKSAPFIWRQYNYEGTRVSIGVRIQHSDGKQTYIVIPQCVVTEVPMDDGNNTISNAQATFSAEGHTATASTIRVYTDY